MEAILAEWGAEIILSLVIGMLTYYFKKDAKDKEDEKKHYEQLLEEERNGKTEKVIEVKLQPIYDELEEIRKRIFALQDHHDKDVENIDEAYKLECKHLHDEQITEIDKLRKEQTENFKKLNDNLTLIIASYKYRLVELCRGLEAQGFMYQYQYDHLREFYNLYRDLGGNGRAQDYYEKVCRELKTKPNPIDYNVV